MYPRAFEYFRPDSLDEALTLLSQYGEEARPLAGGQSLLPLMKLQLASPQVIVDIGRLSAMEYLRQEDGHLLIGALARHVQLEGEDWRPGLTLLRDAAWDIADVQVRNWGTVGGSLAEADPAGDWAPVMLALNASIRCRSRGHERLVEATQFFTDPYTTVLTPEELVTEVVAPLPGDHTSGAYLKLERKSGDFATASVAVQIRWNEEKGCQEAGIGLGGVDATAIKATQAEAFLAGKALEAPVLEEASRLVIEATSPFSDLRGSEEYKREMTGVLFRRAVGVARKRHNGN